ncbi:UDP-glycosyltransferase 73C6 [Hordeum vulgare]|nr:UDP-glycosyltransferase 73C6 [Hordeum vulgare]
MKENFDAQNVSGIDRSERSLRSRWSTINSDCQKWAAAQKADDKLNPSGTNEHDRYNIAQNLFKEETRTTKKGKIKKGKIFTLPHCYEVLKDDEKWKKREDLDDLHLSNKRKRTIELNDDDEEEDASSDDVKRSPTPKSVSYSKPKRPDGCKKDKTEKKKRKGDDELTNVMEAIVKARKEANEVRKTARNQDAAAEERRVAAEERKVALEERKVGMEERAKLLEWEKHLFFLDTSLFNDAQKEYVNLAREEVLIQKRVMICTMGGGGLGAMGGGGLGAMGGMGGFGAMGGMGAPPAAMGGMGGFGAPSNAMGGMGGMSFASLMGGMGGMSFASLMGGMGAPTAMGGMSFDVTHTHTHEDAVEDLAKTVGATETERGVNGCKVREEGDGGEGRRREVAAAERGLAQGEVGQDGATGDGAAKRSRPCPGAAAQEVAVASRYCWRRRERRQLKCSCTEGLAQLRSRGGGCEVEWQPRSEGWPSARRGERLKTRGRRRRRRMDRPICRLN